MRFRHAFNPLLRPFSRLLLRTLQPDDPWRRIPFDVPLERYGLGARRPFEWYFEGESSVEVDSVEALLAWLSGCTYVRDVELFHEKDFWQHPRTFEHIRQGDCEDFAIWAWRKLAEMGYEAEFVAGRCVGGGCPATCHTWVLYEDDGRRWLLDPVIREPVDIVRPLEDVAASYLPEVSVDAAFRRYAYRGYLEVRRSNVEVRRGDGR